jgi:hypothetical protein
MLVLWLLGCGGCGESAALLELTLMDQLGVTHTLGGDTDADVVLLVVHGVGCPIVRKSVPALHALRARYGPDVSLLLVNANPYDTRDAVAEEVADFGLDLPVLLDPDQVLASALGFTRTAEAAVLDGETWALRYFGALDDRLEYGMEKPVATRAYAQDAVDAVLAGELPAVTRTQAKGCALPLR